MARAKMTDEERIARKREYAAEWAAANPERKRAYQAKYRAANRAKSSANSARWRAENPERQREARARWRAANPETTRANSARYNARNRRKVLVRKAEMRATQSGMEFSITVEGLKWPTHCPVLGIELDYEGGKGGQQPNSPSLDRWNNEIGYTEHNTVVISWRANALKKNGTLEELFRVAYYAQYGRMMPPPGLEDVWGPSE